MLKFFYPKKADDFKMSIDDFSYLSSKDFFPTLSLANFGGSSNGGGSYITFENPINMSTVEVLRKVENYEMTSKYSVLTGLSEDQAIKFAEKEAAGLKEALIHGFKYVAKIKKKEESTPILSDYLEKIAVLKKESFLPKR